MNNGGVQESRHSRNGIRHIGDHGKVNTTDRIKQKGSDDAKTMFGILANLSPLGTNGLFELNGNGIIINHYEFNIIFASKLKAISREKNTQRCKHETNRRLKR